MTHGMDVHDKAKQTVSTYKKKLLFRNVPANTVSSKEMKKNSGRWKGQIARSRPSRSISENWEKTPFSLITLIFIVDVAKSVSSFVMRVRAVWQHDVGAQILADVHVTLHDVLERSVVEPADFFVSETWLEWHFSAMETFKRRQWWCVRLGAQRSFPPSIWALCRNPRPCSKVSRWHHEQSPSLRWQWKSILAQRGSSPNTLQDHSQTNGGWRDAEQNLRGWAQRVTNNTSAKRKRSARQWWCFRLGACKSSAYQCLQSIWALCRDLIRCSTVSPWHPKQSPSLRQQWKRTLAQQDHGQPNEGWRDAERKLRENQAGCNAWNTISLATRLTQIRSFTIVSFGLIVTVRDRKSSSSDIFTSLTSMSFSGERPSSRGKRQGDAAIMVGACDLMWSPAGVPSWSRHATKGATHLRRNALRQKKLRFLIEFHWATVNDPLVNTPATCPFVLAYLLWIERSTDTLSKSQSNSTRWYLMTCLMFRLRPLMTIQIMASLSSKRTRVCDTDKNKCC